MNPDTKYYFFSGKGGVGKTSMASATAVHFAGNGLKTLIVTTDPAANLADVFEQEIGHKVTPIDHIANLWAMEIDAIKATREYKDRTLAPYREIFPENIVAVMEEQLNSPCTEEMAAFDKFVDFIDNPDYDVVIFDTAPTGHTVRLLELPVDWSRHITASAAGSGQTCLGPVQTLQESKAKYDRAIAVLQNPERTTFAFVVQPEATPVKETLRSIRELQNIKINSNLIIINGILPPEVCDVPFFKRRREMQEKYLAEINAKLPLPTKRMFLLNKEIRGLPFLHLIARKLWQDEAYEIDTGAEQVPAAGVKHDAATDAKHDAAADAKHVAAADAMAAFLPKPGKPRSIFFAGKGGVGKTSMSCITAVWLARKGVKTLLVTTDPAAHIGEVLGRQVESEPIEIKGVDNLWAVKIDAKKAAAEYTERILCEAAQTHSRETLEVMREQLDSPCTEEMATFNKFLDYVLLKGYECMVFDTAPTGHTLRLLELPIDWSKQLELKVALSQEGELLDKEAYDKYCNVIDIMRDKERTTFNFVLYPENTPIMEAYRAVEELRDVGIATQVVIANLVLPGEYCTNNFFRQRRAMQDKHLKSLQEKFSAAIIEMPMMDKEILGLNVLEQAAQLLFKDN